MKDKTERSREVTRKDFEDRVLKFLSELPEDIYADVTVTVLADVIALHLGVMCGDNDDVAFEARNQIKEVIYAHLSKHEED